MMLHEHLPMLAKFVILLTGILLLPRLMERMRLPGVLGYILAGVLIGPPLLGVVKSNSLTINFFAEIGKLLFMFFVGFEVDMEQFNLARKSCLTFGALTFVLPFAGGLLLARLTGYAWNASMLIGSVIAVAAELGQMIHLEGIVGAFLAGIAVKRSFRGKFALEQLEVIAQSLFIPTFFVSTGFLVDFVLLGNTIIGRPALVFGLIGMLVFGKTIAAWITSKTFGYTGTDTGLITSLTLPQMAATLASAVVAHQALNAADEPLIDSMFVNATLVLVVASCIAGPILTQRYGNRIKIQGIDTVAAPRSAE